MAYPIWKDWFVTLGTGAWFSYKVLIDGVEVFNGKAYSKTGVASQVQVKVNDIVADYLGRAVPDWSVETPVAIPSVYVQVKVANTILDAKELYGNWSYENDFVPEVDGLCFPVDGWITEGQHLLYSTLGNWIPTMRVTYMGERGDFAPWLSANNGDFGNDFFISGWWENVSLDNNGLTGMRVFAVDLSQYSDVYKVEIGGKTWKIWRGCCRYVLHYMNGYGGWDSLLIRGNGKQTDTLKRYTRKVPYDNGTASNRGTENYVNEIGAKYEFHPGPMTERQASRMWHLLNSVSVYLEDLEKGEIRPIVLTNAVSEYKTWDNQGHRLIEYTIEAELAQDRMRR